MVRGQSEMVGRYQLRAKLGSGGFASVYRAYDPTLDRDVAIKILHPHLAHDADTSRRFVREGRALARVRHPNIVQVYDAGEAGEVVYLTMELIEGESLAMLSAGAGTMGVDAVLPIITQVAEALAAVHASGLIHRDVKPPNILIEAGTSRAVLLDLGVAQPVDMTTGTAHGWMVGTPGFMAPEQVAAGQRATVQTDVYQLAATIYALLAGRPPFTGSAAESLYAVVNLFPANLAQLRPDLRPEVAATVMQALAKEPHNRPGGPQAFVRQLRAMAGIITEPPPPRSPPAFTALPLQPAPLPAEPVDPEATPPIVRRLRSGLDAGAQQPPVATPPMEPTERWRAQRAVPERRRPTPWPALLAGGLLIGLALGAGVFFFRALTGGEGEPRRAREQPSLGVVLTPPPALTTPEPATTPAVAAATAAVTPAATAEPASPTAAVTPTRTATPPPPVRTATPPPSPAAVPPPPVQAVAPPEDQQSDAAIPNAGGEWLFTDIVEYGPGSGSRFSFRVRLSQQGASITGSGDLAIQGTFDGRTLRATFRQGGGGGEFIWTFAADGGSFEGTFQSTGFGNGGSSIGRRVGG